MRISAQNNQFVFNLPQDFIPQSIEDKYKVLFDKNMIPYESVIDYINSTIKEIVQPSIQFESVEQVVKRGKKIAYKDSSNINDAFTRELDMTFRAVDSYLNYELLKEVLINFFLDNDKQYIPYFQVHMIDKDGDIIYTTIYKEILLKSISEIRLSYSTTDFSEKTFSITFTYNFIDTQFVVSDEYPIQGNSMFHIDFKPVDDRKI